MDHYIAKGYTFPDQDWWEEKKADVSFLYTVEEEEDSATSARSCRLAESHEETDRRERSESTMKHGSKMMLDSWIEEARQEMAPTSSKITSLGGYVNLAYPLMKTLAKKKRGYYEEMEIKNKELRQRVDRAAANLQRTAETIDRIRSTVSNARVPAEHAEHLRMLLLRKSTRIVESCELVNVLVNMIKNSSKTNQEEPRESGQSKIYGSSVDLI